MAKRSVGLLVVTALTLLVPGRALCQNYVFGPNIRVNNDAPGMSFHSTYSTGQHLIAARGDTVYLVWRDDRGGNSHIFFARSNDAGQSFGPNVRVDNTPSGCVGIMPSLAVDDSGGIHVCWLNYNLSDRRFVYYAKSTDGGQNFLPPVRASDSTMDDQYGYSAIAVSRNGRLVYIARNQIPRPSYPSRIALCRSVDGGNSFVVPDTRVLTDTSAWLEDPTVALVGDSIVLVAFDSVTPPSQRYALLFAKSSDSGSAFSPAVILSDSVGGYPSIAGDTPGRVYLAWVSGLGGVAFAVSENQGDTFSHERLVPQTYGAMNVSLWASPGGRLYLAWWFYRGYPYFDNVRFCSSTDGGQTFSQPVYPCDGPDSTWETNPTVCANGDARVFLAWEDNRNNLSGHDDDIYFATGTLAAISEQESPLKPKMVIDLFPNPARGSIRVSYSVSCPGRMRIEVLNLSGQRVTILKDVVEGAGRQTLIWNCSDARGRRSSAGIYFVRISTVSGAVTRRLVLLAE